MGEFLKTWYGAALFIALDAAAILIVLSIGYRLIFKRLADFFASIVCLAATSPLFLTVFLRGKLYQRRTGNLSSLTGREYAVGKKEKTVVLHAFRTTDDDGAEAGRYGAWLRRTGLYRLPLLFDVFCGRLSFLGVRRLSFTDAAFVEEEDAERFSVRPGLINPLAVTGDENTDYKEMFSSDAEYAKKCGLFRDWKIFFFWLIRTLRGEKRAYLGTTAAVSYAESLLADGAITREEFEAVESESRAEIAELEKAYENSEEEDDEDGGEGGDGKPSDEPSEEDRSEGKE